MSSEAGHEIVIRLQRDALSTPWGFRLQGGKDFKSPLRVQRVFVGSPAEGELQRGDVILAIDNYDVTQLIHKEAEELIRKAGGSTTLRVRRGGAASRQAPSPSPAFVRQTSKSPSSTHPQQQQMNFGTDFSQYAGGRPAGAQAGRAQHRPANSQQDGSMLNRLNSSLNQALYEGGAHGGNGIATDDDYESKSVGQLKQQFATLPASSGHGQAANGPKKRWSKPQKPTFSPAPNHLTEIGWTPFTSKQQPASRWSSQHNRQRPTSPPINSSTAPPRHHQPPRPATAHEFDTPAWAGTLRSSGGPRFWELNQAESIAPASVSRHRESRSEPPVAQEPVTSSGGGGGVAGPTGGPVQPHQPKVQVMRYGPTGQQVYEQHGEQYGDSESARVLHLQYNSPLGLYSRENVETALEGQTHDKAGYGTMQVSGGNPGKQFNPQNSAVLRLLAEEEGRKVGGRGQRVRPGGGASELKQSPMIYALDATYGNGAVADEQQQPQAGMSDF